MVASAAVWNFEVLDVTDAVCWDNSVFSSVSEDCSRCVDVEWDVAIVEPASIDEDTVGGVMPSPPYRWLVIRCSFRSEEVYMWSASRVDSVAWFNAVFTDGLHR